MATMPHAITGLTGAIEEGNAFQCVSCSHDRARRGPLVTDGPSPGFELWQCDGCGLVQQYPRWAPTRIASLYGEDYYVFSECEEHRWSRAVQQYAVHLSRFESASRPGAAGLHGMRLLDVGCALGHLAALARGRGWRVTGIDISASAVSQAAVRFGLDVRAGSLSRHADTLSPCDVVLLGDVIEHVADPGRLLRDVRKVLAPGGSVCIDTPNWGGFWRRWGGSRWIGLNRFHINLFDAECLRHLLESSGFHDITVVSYNHYRYEGWSNRPEVRGWAEKLPRIISWRLLRYMENRHPLTRWSALRDHPPTTPEEAIQRLTDLCNSKDSVTGTDLTGDNLVVMASR